MSQRSSTWSRGWGRSPKAAVIGSVFLQASGGHLKLVVKVFCKCKLQTSMILLENFSNISNSPTFQGKNIYNFTKGTHSNTSYYVDKSFMNNKGFRSVSFKNVDFNDF